MQSKRCSKCGETKLVSGFHRDRTRSDGLGYRCKECFRAYKRAYNDAHREEVRARDRAYARSYHEEHKEGRRAYARAYNEAHREERCAYYRAYREAHRDECNAQHRKRKTEAWNASREVATRNGEPWTPAEDHVVLTLEGTALDIAIELGRTTSSVQKRRKKLRSKAVTA